MFNKKNLRIGKKQWIPIPSMMPQFSDKRGYLSCPSCNAFLADMDVKKGVFYGVPIYQVQINDDRENITCYKCHCFLGKAVWLKPTIGEWYRALAYGKLSRYGVFLLSLVLSIVFTSVLFFNTALTVWPELPWYKIVMDVSVVVAVIFAILYVFFLAVDMFGDRFNDFNRSKWRIDK